MKKICTLVSIAFMNLALTPLSAAADNQDTPVVSMMTNSAQGFGLHLQSDGASYSNDMNVESVIQEYSDDWVLNTGFANSTRRVFVDLTDFVPGSAPGGKDPLPPFSTALVQPRIISKCHEREISMYAIPVGTTVLCPMAVTFLYTDGATYRLASNADNYRVSNDVSVTCLAGGFSGCGQWHFAPSATYLSGTDPNYKNIIRLLLIPKSNNEDPRELGSFYLSFSIDVSKSRRRASRR